jgi:hypothetical protein
MKRHGDNPMFPAWPIRQRSFRQPIMEKVNATFACPPQVCLVFSEELPQLVKPSENSVDL